MPSTTEMDLGNEAPEALEMRWVPDPGKMGRKSIFYMGFCHVNGWKSSINDGIFNK